MDIHGVAVHNFYSRTSYEVRLALPNPFVLVTNFYSRTSYEVRRSGYTNLRVNRNFSLTHLLRGATISLAMLPMCILISTHAPLTRCDCSRRYALSGNDYFYSRTSYEVRLDENGNFSEFADFYSRTSYEVRLLHSKRLI